MRYKIIVVQPVLTTVIVTADSENEAVDILLRRPDQMTEELGCQTWEKPRIRSIEELGE
ncbi:hypothetical protein [Microbulbifer marinus]|uniref:Uncharacterized protein n=1 Tax=Microbulbifer marinus TaxID=658218 RepID=A0A1H3YXW6_9GAMM|nr:hypothetical protein [Microbulbifer marinus]SEA16423.1 hypothetical protein SAMN05216562_2057 [Microbulbifer marinus]